MSRRPHWRRGLRSVIRYYPYQRSSVWKKIFGGILCLIGFGVILASVPGWLYLLCLGAGLVLCGMWIIQGN